MLNEVHFSINQCLLVKFFDFDISHVVLMLMCICNMSFWFWLCLHALIGPVDLQKRRSFGFEITAPTACWQ